jgi:hypothetical protein
VGSCGLDAYGSEQWQVAGSCEHGNEHSGPIKGGAFVEQLGDYQFFKDSAAWSN